MRLSTGKSMVSHLALRMPFLSMQSQGGEYDKHQRHTRKWKSELQTNRGRQRVEHLSARHLRRNRNDGRAFSGSQLLKEVRQTSRSNQRARCAGHGRLDAKGRQRCNSGSSKEGEE